MRDPTYIAEPAGSGNSILCGGSEMRRIDRTKRESGGRESAFWETLYTTHKRDQDADSDNIIVHMV